MKEGAVIYKDLGIGGRSWYRSRWYWLTGIGLTVVSLVLRGSAWKGSAGLHTAMESIATILSLAVGFLALRRFRRHNDSLLLLIGVGFLGTAFLDGYHAVVTSSSVKDYLPSNLPSLIPWSWVASRFYLSLTMYFSYIVWKRERILGTAGKLDPSAAYIVMGAFSIFSFLFFAFIPLPRAYYPEFVFHRPEEFVPALFFALALHGFLKKGTWRVNLLEHWIVLSLIVNLVGQTAFMASSGQLFDFDFDAAHLLKKVSYICVLIGLAYNLTGIDEGVTATSDRLSAASPAPVRALGITLKFAIFNTALVFAILLILAMVTYLSLFAKLREDDLSAFAKEINNAGLVFEERLRNIRDDVTFLSRTPPVQGIIRSDNDQRRDALDQSSDQQWRDRLTQSFEQILWTKPDYLSIRYIGKANGGREMVRVDRVGGEILVVNQRKLRTSGQSPYFKQAQTLKPGQVYLTNMSLTDEFGNSVVAQRPVLRALVAVFSEREPEAFFGAVVINVDMSNIFDSLRGKIVEERNLYVTNSNGDYLYPPDTQQTIGFESDQEINMRGLIPNLAEVLKDSSQKDSVILQRTQDSEDLAVSYYKVALDVAAPKRFLALITVSDYERAPAASMALGKQFALTGILVTCIAVILGWVFARTLTQPLTHITQIMATYGEGMRGLDLPVNAGDEIGLLARTFDKLTRDIAERTRRLEGLVDDRKQAEERFQQVFESTPNGILIVDKDRKITLANSQVEHLFGYTREELMGQPIETLIPQRFRANHPENVAGFFKNPSPRAMGAGRDLYALRKDGSEFSVEIGLRSIATKTGVFVIASVVDITERKKIDEERQQAEERFQQVFESTPNGILIVDKDRKITLANSQVEHLFGYTREELMGQTIETLIPERFQPNHPENVTGFFKNPSPRAMGAGRDLYALRKDGSEFSVEIGLRSIATKSGVFVIASVVDISERKKIEEERQQAEERFQQVFESTPNGILIVDRDRKIALANSQVEHLFGYSREELIGQPIETLIPERFQPSHPENVAGFFKNPSPRAMGAGRDLYALRKDGAEFSVEIGLRSITTKSGGFVIASVVDISERKKNENALKLYSSELEQRNKDLDDFAYVASHDLKSPLRAIRNLSQWVIEDAGDVVPDESKDHLHRLGQRVEKMEELLDDLLTYSRAGRAEETQEIIDTSELVNDIKELINIPADISVRMTSKLPRIRAPKSAMKQILQNLISNAVKYHDKQNGLVEIGAIEYPGRIEFSVADNGPGIPPEYHGRIFKLFQSLDSNKESKGTGMGLAIVKKLVERYGGSIRLESKPGEGSTFFFTWPSH